MHQHQRSAARASVTGRVLRRRERGLIVAILYDREPYARCGRVPLGAKPERPRGSEHRPIALLHRHAFDPLERGPLQRIGWIAWLDHGVAKIGDPRDTG